MYSSATTESYLQDMVKSRDALRRDGQQQLLLNIDSAFLSHQLFKVIEMTKTKTVNCLHLPVYNVNEATNTVKGKWCVLIYAIRHSCKNLLKVIIINQVAASLALPIPSSNASARVGDEEETIAACAVLPGQQKDGMEGEGV